jgi:hypothetical protein
VARLLSGSRQSEHPGEVRMLLLLAAIVEAADCRKGKPCGASCIAWDKTCHVGYSTPEPYTAPNGFTWYPGGPMIWFDFGYLVTAHRNDGAVLILEREGTKLRCERYGKWASPLIGATIYSEVDLLLLESDRFARSEHIADTTGLKVRGKVADCTPLP